MYRTLISAALALTLCACSTTPSRVEPPKTLLIVACPEQLPPLTDTARNALVRKIAEISQIYHECRAAAVAQ